ncbi:MAG: PQQ-binding-like beta-propeller repeat protein [Acidobacteria bacterium]|nr:PQQ-binding-like beta-propeller repeat protein [Acidobacteriota bacterium]
MRPLPLSTSRCSSRRLPRPPAVLALTSLALLLVPAPAARAADWPEFDGDGRHNGNNQQETIINSGNVSTLHVLYPAVTLPGIADGAPAFLTGVTTSSGVKDLLFLTTKNGYIVALDAATGTTLWSHQPATGPNYTTSSPAVDPNGLYVYSYGLEGRAHKYQVGDGTEIMTGGWPELATLKPSVEKCSPPLSVVVTNAGTSYLYVANGGYPGDAGDYQGHITAINLATGAQNVFNTQCSDQTVHFVQSPGTPDCSNGVQSAVWARPAVLYSTELDRIFFATGNATYDANTGGHNWGDSVLATHPDGTGTGVNGQPLDSYTPVEFQTLQNDDADLGSTAPALLPALAGSNIAHLAVQSGKDAQLRLLNLSDLSGSGGPAHVGGELQKIGVPQGGEVLTQPAVWVNPVDGAVWVFVANDSGVSGLKMTVDGSGNPSMSPTWQIGNGGTSPVVANGMLFYFGGSGVTALDPATGTQLWNDTSPGGVHWESTVVIDGRLFITDENSKLWAYAPNAAPLRFYTITPCRVVDTRQANGPYGGPALAGNGARRLFQLAGQCGVPAGAKALAANVTTVSPATDGLFRVGPSGVANVTSTLNFKAGQIRASNTVIGLTGNPLGAAWVESDSAGAAHLLIDVSGYFQ